MAAQDYPGLDHLVVDDGSTDDLSLKIKSFGDRIRYIRQENLGPSAARSLGLAESKSELIAFLDIDDLWAPGHLRRLVNALLADRDAGIAQALIRTFITGEDGRRYFTSKPFRFYLVGSHLYRREAVAEAGGFDETMQMSEDYDFALRCWENDILKIPVDAVGLYYRRHATALTATRSGVVDAGTVRVFKRRADRIRRGLLDPGRQRRLDAGTFLGAAPKTWDEGIRELIAEG